MYNDSNKIERYISSILKNVLRILFEFQIFSRLFVRWHLIWILLLEPLILFLIISLTELSKEMAYDNDGAHIEAHDLAVDPEVHLGTVGQEASLVFRCEVGDLNEHEYCEFSAENTAHELREANLGLKSGKIEKTEGQVQRMKCQKHVISKLQIVAIIRPFVIHK